MKSVISAKGAGNIVVAAVFCLMAAAPVVRSVPLPMITSLSLLTPEVNVRHLPLPEELRTPGDTP